MQVLIVVDVQNDFCEGGSLAVVGGAAVAADIQRFLVENRATYDLVVASQDWHHAEESNGGHFAPEGEAPDFVQTWPGHCVAGDHGADFHQALHPALPTIDVHVRKGMGIPAYSAFEGVCVDREEPLAKVLQGFAALHAPTPVIHIDVVGIATDYCVAATAVDALSVPNVGSVRIIERLTAAVNPQTWRTVKRSEVQGAGVLVV